MTTTKTRRPNLHTLCEIDKAYSVDQILSKRTRRGGNGPRAGGVYCRGGECGSRGRGKIFFGESFFIDTSFEKSFVGNRVFNDSFLGIVELKLEGEAAVGDGVFVGVVTVVMLSNIGHV